MTEYFLPTAINEQHCIHPAFRISASQYAQNLPWRDERRPDIKATVKFTDPSLLDNCPFPCKIAPNVSTGPRFFGVAYALKEQEAALVQWAARFPEAKLLTYNGHVIKVL